MDLKCKICKNKIFQIYATPPLPEYIWPGQKKYIYSKCKLYICSKCYSYQLQNFTIEKIKSFYGKQAFNIQTKTEHLKRLGTIRKFYGNNFFKNKKIIDIGGGINPIINSKNVDVLDFKISKEDKKKLKNNLLIGNIEKLNIKKKYDIIFLLHTLEHLQNPLKVLKKIEKILNKNGYLFLEVPNFNYYIKKLPHYAIFHQHLNMYEIKNLRNLISLLDLKIEKVFKNKDVIFCSLIKKKRNKYVMNKVFYKKKISLLKKNIIKQKNKIIKFCKKDKINILGAGGSAALFLANHNFIKNRISNIYDISLKKKGKQFPGIKLKIKKNKKCMYNLKTISFYKINNTNNLNII